MTLHKDITNTKTIIRFKTLEKEFNKFHNNKYDYSKSIYKGITEKIIIICPIHGEFEQNPSQHLNTKGCCKCGKLSTSKALKKSNEEFIERAKNIHGNKYDYSLVEYKNMKTKVKIICPIHGIFEQNSNNHLTGIGCPKCSYDKIKGRNKISLKDYITRCTIIHNNKYNYNMIKDLKGKVVIICPIHGQFSQNYSSHLNGCGCSKCAIINKDYKYGINDFKDKRTTLYYIKIEKEGFPVVWKIGITKNDTNKRFRTDISNGCKITILKEEIFENGKYAWLKEQLILNSLKEYQYKGDKLLHSGNTELFTKDCYMMENQNSHHILVVVN